MKFKKSILEQLTERFCLISPFCNQSTLRLKMTHLNKTFLSLNALKSLTAFNRTSMYSLHQSGSNKSEIICLPTSFPSIKGLQQEISQNFGRITKVLMTGLCLD